MPATATFRVRALLLDMDGTLVNSDAVVERVWSRWAARHGLAREAVLRVVHGRQGHMTMAELLPDRPMTENLAENAVLLAEETGDLDGVVPVAGAGAFLAALAGSPHALVTSASEALARARMGAAGLPLPPVLVTSERVSASKPDPEGFLKGAAELGFAPEECLVFEDAEVGIAAAKAAGMRVVGVGPRAAAHGPTAHVPSLDHVLVAADPDSGLHVTVR
ncbi:HAD-IA family hydrolase [Streptomyces sp. HPF1205]|uniref:HAD-IA family hydrolase n=1 Tax=Streptomyces sp. HPF1205 TaxID=2873262 RepID=UPI001CEDF02F|nr:HAD-IA family hydrolase [Streptomyces sp. HPF1205]